MQNSVMQNGVMPNRVMHNRVMHNKTNQNSAVPDRRHTMKTTSSNPLGRLLLVYSLLLSGQVCAQSNDSTDATRTLRQLTNERLMLTAELDQFQQTLEMVHTDGTPPEQSPNSAVRTLAIGAVTLKQQLIAITEQEVSLLQQQITAAREKARGGQDAAADTPSDTTSDNQADPTDNPPDNPSDNPSNNQPGDQPDSHFAVLARAEAFPAGTLDAIDSNPLRTAGADSTLEQEAETVERLHKLLESYYAELQESARILPTPEEIALRELARRDAETLNAIPFSVDKVRLSGSEGSTALAQISQRLVDPRIPESRRDMAPICSIKTRLLDTLVGVENRSLKPVGKNHYIVRVRLQPGETTISILSDHWKVDLPQHANAQDFLITLYRPVTGTPELHVFAVDELLAADNLHIPAWLPEELDIKTNAG